MRLFTINSVPLHNEMSVSCGENDGGFSDYTIKGPTTWKMPSMDCSTVCFVRLFLLNHAFTGYQPVVISLSILLLARSTVVVSSELR